MLELPTPALIGVVHLHALPGSPRHVLSMEEIVERALADARILEDAGFDAVLLENYGDAPYFADTTEPGSVAGMAVVAEHVRRAVSMPIGVNALRNDAMAALGIAAAVGAAFIRVNVHCGVTATDQGMIEGRAAQSLRYRKRLGRPVVILADVHVKHGTSLNQPDIAAAARETAYRGLADGLIVTGPATGEPVDFEQLTKVRDAVPDRRLFVGSGATADTVASLLTIATGVIVGTGIKEHGETAGPVDASLARAFARATGRR